LRQLESGKSEAVKYWTSSLYCLWDTFCTNEHFLQHFYLNNFSLAKNRER
jgi:hypothetical protein